MSTKMNIWDVLFRHCLMLDTLYISTSSDAELHLA